MELDDDDCDGTCGARGCDPNVCLGCGYYQCRCDLGDESDTPLDVPKCCDCGEEIGDALHRCTPEVAAADDIGEMFTDTGGEG